MSARTETASAETSEASTIERTLALVGDRWTILVLRAAFRGIRRFDELCADLGIARPILTSRLRKLVAAGLMTRKPYQEHPARFEYRLTSAGVALSPVRVALVRWGAISTFPAANLERGLCTGRAARNSSRDFGASPVLPRSVQVRYAASMPE